VWSREFEGNQRCLKIYPGGDASADKGMVSLYLKNMSDKAIGKILVSDSTMAMENKWLTIEQKLKSIFLLWSLKPALVIEVHVRLAQAN
jgi:hypothetical protein